MKYGVFNLFWDNYPNHLPFLNLVVSLNDPKEWNLQTSISKLCSILRTSSKQELNEGLQLLLQSRDWRPHLVALISLLTIDVSKSAAFVDQLWDRLALGSWVSPQIVVVLSMIDRNFAGKAENMLNEADKLNFTSLSSPTYYVSRDGTSSKAAKTKTSGAIHYFLSKTIDRQNDPEMGGAIAKAWADRLSELFASGQLQVNRL